MSMRRTIPLLLFTSLVAFAEMAAQTNPTPSQVNSERRLGRLTELEQKGRYGDITEPLAELIRSNTLNERESGRAELLLGSHIISMERWRRRRAHTRRRSISSRTSRKARWIMPLLSITSRVSYSIQGIRIPHCASKPTRSG